MLSLPDFRDVDVAGELYFNHPAFSGLLTLLFLLVFGMRCTANMESVMWKL